MPLHSACRNGHDAIVRLLLRCGVDPFVADEYGLTPFDLARDWQRIDILDMLRGIFSLMHNAASAWTR